MNAIIKDRDYWLEWQLQNWASWMRSDQRPEGLPEKACGGVTGYTILGDSETAYEALDAHLAEVTNAAIGDLPSLQQKAVYRAYGVMAQLEQVLYAQNLILAKLAILAGLQLRGVWMGA